MTSSKTSSLKINNKLCSKHLQKLRNVVILKSLQYPGISGY